MGGGGFKKVTRAVKPVQSSAAKLPGFKGKGGGKPASVAPAQQNQAEPIANVTDAPVNNGEGATEGATDAATQAIANVKKNIGRKRRPLLGGQGLGEGGGQSDAGQQTLLGG